MYWLVAAGHDDISATFLDLVEANSAWHTFESCDQLVVRDRDEVWGRPYVIVFGRLTGFA